MNDAYIYKHIYIQTYIHTYITHTDHLHLSSLTTTQVDRCQATTARSVLVDCISHHADVQLLRYYHCVLVNVIIIIVIILPS